MKDDEVYGVEGTTYDFGARLYDSRLGRWMSIDPLAKEAPGWTPYRYGFNNPIRYTDPTGMFEVDGKDDWIYDKQNKEYVWNGNVTRPENTPKGFEYVGPSENDVKEHYKENHPVKYFFGIAPTFGENHTPYHGEIRAKETNWVDNWAESDNILAQASYSTVNSFSIVGQSLNPFDNQVTALTGEYVGHTDRSAHAVEVAATLIPVGKVKVAAKTGTSLVKTGAQWSKHSLQRLAERGVTKDMAEMAISKGQKFYAPLNKSINNYVLPNGYASGKSLLVGTNPLTGEVTTVIRSSKNLINKRFIPIK